MNTVGIGRPSFSSPTRKGGRMTPERDSEHELTYIAPCPRPQSVHMHSLASAEARRCAVDTR